MTLRSDPTRPHGWTAWAFAACGVMVGPALLGAAHATPMRPLTLASVAVALTALLVGFALRQRRALLAAVSPARRPRALGWSPP